MTKNLDAWYIHNSLIAFQPVLILNEINRANSLIFYFNLTCVSFK